MEPDYEIQKTHLRDWFWIITAGFIVLPFLVIWCLSELSWRVLWKFKVWRAKRGHEVSQFVKDRMAFLESQEGGNMDIYNSDGIEKGGGSK